jgi:ribosomal protein S13
VQVPGSSGGGGGQNINSNFAAPLSPQASVTTLNQAQVNQIGNIAAKAYVVESDVTGNQERIRRLNRAARIS